MNICHKASEARDRLLHRTVAAVLAAAMTLSLLPAASWAVYPATPPVQITDDTKSKFPNIEFQTNFVRTEYGTLTGLMELAIRVGPSKKDGDDKPIAVNFQSVAATLQYNTTLFQPISWKWAYKEDGTANDVDLKLSADKYYDVQLPAKKDDTLPGTGAIAQCGIVDNPTGMTPNVADGKQALLFFKAEAYGTKLTLTEMTTLAVIRFYVKPELMEHISIVRDKTSIKPDGSCDYNVFFDTTTQVTDRAGLDAAIRTTSGKQNPVDAPADALDPDLMKLLTSDFISVGFAADEDMAVSKSPAGMSLHYSAGDNEFYHVPGCDPTDPNPATNTGLENVKVKVGPTTPKTEITLPAPVTGGSRVLAVAEGKDNSILAADYSYLSNLIPADNITFPVVSRPSFADNGDGRENMVTVLFYDWDDTLIGVLVVPRNDDARALVNDYVCNNMIHPDLRYGVGDTTMISSLARQYTYRGKYPCTPMAENGTDSTMDSQRTDKLVGSDYPLTNKLDYVFLKRPMKLTTSGVTSTNEPTSTWTQPGTDGAAEWDNEYPYIHGWALIPDDDLTDIQYTHPKNIWTTVGLGELGTYNGAANGGYRTMNGAPAVLTATGEEFEFANFDFYANPQPKGATYAVKAVYEPGENLLPSGRRYRMISEPYYNKLNAPSADAGGAYSVDVVFERASTEVDNLLQGVARIREPGVRQDTTTDLKWEENVELGIEHNLLNATIREAYTSKSKTTYTKIEIANTEEIPISLTLSARQNKVDYYIKEMYNSNFVVGGARTENDNNRAGLAKTMDNYNYRVTESNLTDEWYDAQYSDRDGSYGFVLIGTLHQLMELATQCNDKKLTKDDFYSYVTETTLSDINLRLDADGRTAESFEDIDAVIDALVAAADDAKKNHYGATGYWNSDPVHNCAELTYHQLQLFVIDYMPDKSASLLNPSAADAVIVKWCHLHEECVAKTSGKPRNWNELITTAQGPDSDAEKIRKISLLTAVEMEDIAHLRADANGTPFATVDAFAAKVLAAVKAGHTSWDAVQDHIIRNVGDASHAKANYWWYDGTTSVPLDSLNQLINTTPDAYTAVTLPDGVKETRQGKLNQLLPAYTANAALAGDETDPAWVLATENLCADSDAGKFATFEAFKTAFLAALAKANAAASAAGEDMTIWRPSWNQLQYTILHSSEPFPLVPTTTQEAEFKTYYWRNGGRKVTDVASMLLAAQRANQGDTVSWDAFNDFNDLYTYSGLQFRKSFKGEKYAAADFGTFKSTIQTLAIQGTNRTWEQVQYYLIHGSLGGSNAVNSESPYYWWKDGGVGESVDFSAVTDYNTGLSVFLDAAFRAEFNGNIHAWDELNHTWNTVNETWDLDEAKGLATIKTGRLIKKDNAATTFDALEHFASVSEFLTAISGISSAAGGKGAAPGQDLVKPDSRTVTWQQMQKYLLDDTLTLAGDEDYWWRDNDSKGSKKTELDYLNEIRAALQKVIDNNDFTDINAWLGNVDNVNAIFANRNNVAFTAQNLARVISSASRIWPAFKNAYSDANNISWYQIEYALVAQRFSNKTDSEVKTMLEDSFKIPTPAWVLALDSSKMMSMRVPTLQPEVEVEIDEETGIMTTTTPDTITELPNGLTQVQRTITVLSPEGEILEVTTFIEIYDADYNLVSEQTVTMPVPEPEEPTCTCGSEDGTHAENCPLYVAPEEPICTCGSEDGTHAEDCPLYVAPEEPTCTCGSEDGTHAEDCPLYEAPTETEEPTESPEPTESIEPSESLEATPIPEPTEPAKPSESPEATPTPEPTDLPEPTETASPEEELPEPSVPGAETPEPTPTPEVTVTPTPEPTATPGGTLETMPEIIDPDNPEPEPSKKPEEEPSEKPNNESSGTVETTPSPQPSEEAVVTETQPPLAGVTNLRSRSAPMVYNKLTTKLTMQSKKPVTLPGRLLLHTGGMNMKQLKLNRIFSPPGWPLFGAVPLRLYADIRERGCAV